jgi:protein-S-isoprenylcysteine O-methyltransferase Ste14
MKALAILARWRVRLGVVTVVAALVLARPTWISWCLGFAMALLGEGIRIWAAGHLEKSREVTRSGPYRWMAHPLYVGSSALALGVVVAARSLPLVGLAVLYMGATITAAIRTEEARLREVFGPAYDDYRAAKAEPMPRRFSLERAARNREYKAVTGLVVGFALLALRIYVLL